MKRSLINLATFFILFLIVRSSSGQSTSMPNVNTPSPNASSLGQYGEVPVSLFTGVPNIGVPIYTVQDGSYKLPISLSYHYSGVRPNLCPGSTGANWTLMAGGAITRIIKGMPDEGSSPYLSTLPVKNYGFLFNSQLPSSDLLSTVVSTQDNFNNYIGAYITPPFNAAGSVEFDLDPDEFDFSFCGISGSFYLDGTGAMRVKCDRDVKVSYDDNTTLQAPFLITYLNAQGIGAEPGTSINNTFSTFTITDEDGTQYKFGEKTVGSNGISSEAVEYSTSWTSNAFHATSWYLTSILLTNGHKISFTYDRGPFTTQIDKQALILTGGTSGSCPPLVRSDIGTIPQTTLINTGLTYSAAIQSPIYLRNISTSSGTTVNLNYALSGAQYYSADTYYKILQLLAPNTLSTPYPLSGENTNQNEKQQYIFWCASNPFIQHTPYCNFGIPYYSSNPQIFGITPTTLTTTSSCTNYFTRLFNWFKLTGITVTDNFNGVNIRNFGFAYDETGMLKLTQLQNLDSQNSLINKYQFTYNTTQMTLPGLLTDQTDHWGYYNYNGQTYTQQNFTFPTYVSNKNTYITGQSLIAEKAEILKTITYPTGGTTSFEPDNNYFAKVIDRSNPNNQYDSLGYAGGVRIKRIINRDAQGNMLTQKTYYYLHGYQNGIDTSTLSSSGELAALPQYSYRGNYSYVSLNQDGTIKSQVTIPFFQFGTEPIIPGSQNNMGSYIGYSEVAEVGQDGGYSIYKYTNYSDGTAYRDAPPDMRLNVNNNPNELYPFPNNDNSELRGHLKSIQKNIASNQPVEQKIYDQFQPLYTIPNSNIRSISGGELFESCDLYAVMGAANTTNLFTYAPTRETDLLYNPDGSYMQNIITTTYNTNYKKILSQTSTASDGTNLVTSYTYPFSQSDPASYAMTKFNIVNPIVSRKIQKNGAPTKVTTDTYQQYSTPHILNSEIFTPSSRQLQIGSNPVETRENFLAYDNNGNLLCEAKPGGANISYQWGYNNQYPTVKIENAANSIDTVVQSTGNQNAYLTLPVGSTQTYQQVINVANNGSTSITLGFTGIPNSNTVASINISITGPNGYSNNFILCNGVQSGSCSYPQNQTVTNLVQGTYIISASYNYSQNLNASVQISANYPGFIYVPSGVKEFYYEGFEENSAGTLGTAHTGNKYFSGSSYTVNWTTPNARSYVISYWYLNAAGVWTYISDVVYTGNQMVLSVTGATAYDDIRICPIDALMTTYTYNPLVGMTSIIDPKGMTSYFEYDTFQRLMNVKDKDGNIVKHIDYHYQGQ